MAEIGDLADAAAQLPDSLRFIELYQLSGSAVDSSKGTMLSGLRLGQYFEAPKSLVVTAKKQKRSHIGKHFLKQYIVTLDWKNQQIMLSPSNSVKDDSLMSFGLSIYFVDEKLVIGTIYKNSSASQMGLTIGDQIIAINGTDYSNATQDDYCALTQKSLSNLGEVLSIKVKHGNTTIERTLQKTNLFETMPKSNAQKINFKSLLI
jgi:predicted metalloprotease with PDZ domain